jgi:hypothetical protein
MTVTVRPDTSGTDVYRFDFTGRWTWDEVFRAINEAVEMGSVTVRNDVILMLEDANYLPSGAIEKVKNISHIAPHNGGLFIMVGLGAFPAVFLNVFRRLYPEGQFWRTVRTIEEARAIIRQHRIDAGLR